MRRLVQQTGRQHPTGLLPAHHHDHPLLIVRLTVRLHDHLHLHQRPTVHLQEDFRVLLQDHPLQI